MRTGKRQDRGNREREEQRDGSPGEWGIKGAEGGREGGGRWEGEELFRKSVELFVCASLKLK